MRAGTDQWISGALGLPERPAGETGTDVRGSARRDRISVGTLRHLAARDEAQSSNIRGETKLIRATPWSRRWVVVVEVGDLRPRYSHLNLFAVQHGLGLGSDLNFGRELD